MMAKERLHRVSARRREDLRQTFLPAHVRVLFIGESPPAAGTFFYAGDSGLFRATRDVFYDVFDGCERFETFLDCFAALGCYLEDLCHDPVNHLTNRVAGGHAKRLAARRAGEAGLAQTISELQPAVIVVLLKGIMKNVSRAAAAAGRAGVELHDLTYPSRWHRHRLAYRSELTGLLRDLVRRRVLPKLL